MTEPESHPHGDPLAALAGVKARIARAMAECGRTDAGPELIAVTKTVEAARIAPLLGAGHASFGENRVQEAKAKWPELRAGMPGLTLHLVGTLQSNKVREALALFDAVHSLDRASLAAALRKEIDRVGRQPRLFVQINTGEEPQKGGVPPGGADAFLDEARGAFGLAIEGLMCVPPADEAPGPHFALLRKIAARNGLAGLSMGMSGDFETAVRFGATQLRVGSAIFGARPPISSAG